ncbi:MAG: 2-hydroxyacyl-CoA dehydratase [Candidatus Thorarchaeota archaeon]|nr:MAG: 2-hydroxyacyl-CoA dehydratase [Candidatus Thorarchaeota archaeon]
MSYPILIEQSNQILRELVDAGQPVLGYIYPHIPHEIVMAHGLTPSLVRTNPTTVGAYEDSLQTFSCSLTRNLFSQRVNGSFPLLAGIVFSSNTCDALQNVADVWRLRFPEDNVIRLTYPVGDSGNPAVQYLALEIKAFSDALESLTGVAFQKDAFIEAASIVGGIRRGLQLLYSARLVNPSLIPYDTLSELVGEFMTAPTKTVLTRIEKKWAEVLDGLKKEKQDGVVEKTRTALLSQDMGGINLTSDSAVRIAFIGGMVEPTTIADLINNVPGMKSNTVVLDVLTFGFRTVFTPPVETEGDPFEGAARSILGAPSEPTQEGLSKRVKLLKDVLTHLSIGGLVVCEQSFCDPDEFEAPSTERAAAEVGVPIVRLPIDPELSDRARLEGRLQTFLETLDAS